MEFCLGTFVGTISPKTFHGTAGVKITNIRKLQIGAIYLWRPHGGEEVRLRWTHVDGGRGSSPMRTSTQKIKNRVHCCLLLMQRNWCLFFQNFVFRRNKKWKISYRRISALGPEDHCTSRFKRAMCISCRPHVDVHKVKGVRLMWTHVDRGKGGQNPDFCCGRHKWMAPIDDVLIRPLEWRIPRVRFKHSGFVPFRLPFLCLFVVQLIMHLA